MAEDSLDSAGLEYFETPTKEHSRQVCSDSESVNCTNPRYFETPSHVFSPGDTISEPGSTGAPPLFYPVTGETPGRCQLFRPLDTRPVRNPGPAVPAARSPDPAPRENEFSALERELGIDASTDSHPAKNLDPADSVEGVDVPCDSPIAGNFDNELSLRGKDMSTAENPCNEPSPLGEDLYAQVHAKQIEVEARTAELKNLKVRYNAKLRMAQRKRYLQFPPQVRAVHNVYTYVRSKTSHSLSADGGDTNAELTKASANDLIQHMMNEGVITATDVVMDGGCAYNVFASHVAQLAKCKVWGCEYVPTRVFIATGNMLRALEDPDDVGSLINPKIAYVPVDLYKLTSFGPTTVAYFFDEAFSLRLVEHICLTAAKTSSLSYILSFKASKRSSVHSTFARFGFVRLPEKTKKVRKSGGEHNTVYVYERADCALPEPTGDHKSVCACARMSDDVLANSYLWPAWSDDPTVRRRHYERLHAAATLALPTSRKRNVTTASSSTCVWCEKRSCCTNVLCLGMVYWDTGATTVDGVAKLVLERELTPAMGRDTARCLALEAMGNACVYTVAKQEEQNVRQRADRHVNTDICSRRFVRDIKKVTKTVAFDQVSLDYFWMPRAYLHDRVGRQLIGRLKAFALELLQPKGCIYLPFHMDILSALAKTDATWAPYYDICLVSQRNTAALRENLLWTATGNIPSHTMEEVFEKRSNQESIYCRVTKAEVKSLPKPSVLSAVLLEKMDDIESYRFICLRRNQHKRT